MKKISIFLFVFTFVLNFMHSEIHRKDGILFLHEGTSVSIKPGWQREFVNKKNINDYYIDLIFIEPQFKHQVIDNFYVNTFVSYGFGKRNKDNAYTKHYNWNVEGNVGWTFHPFKTALFSPFFGLGWRHLKEKRNEDIEGSDDGVFYDIRFSDIYALVGGDFQYLFSKNLSVGLNGGLGISICPEISYQSGDRLGGSLIYGPKEKHNAKHQPFARVTLPISCHFDTDTLGCYKVGLELNYQYIPRKLKSSVNSKVRTQSDTISQILGVTLCVGYFF